MHICCRKSKAKAENIPIRNEWENASQTAVISEKMAMIINKICMCWVTGDIEESGHVIFISLEWEMRAEKRETNQVPSVLLQKFRLKINIAAYGGAAWVLVALGLLNPKLWVFRISYISMYILSMWSKRCGIQIKLRRILFPFFQLLGKHTGVRQLMMSHTLADAIHTHYKTRRGAKNP